jgi:hypothetical protein
LTSIDVALAAMAYLLAKHAIADFMLQTPYQWKNKGRYGHPGGLLHAGIHSAFSVPVFAILAPLSPTLAAGILVAEFVVHYHTDWAKEKAGMVLGLLPSRAGYWWAMGVDQLVHGLTYVAMVAVLAEPRRMAAFEGMLVAIYR